MDGVNHRARLAFKTLISFPECAFLELISICINNQILENAK